MGMRKHAFTWTEDYAIGVREIDAQHAAMFERIEALLTACEQGRGSEEIAGLFSFLEAYAGEHFADEEALMANLGYPGRDEHQRMHAEYITEIRRLKAVLAEEGVNAWLAAEMNAYLVNWLISHITVEDLKIAKFLPPAD